MRRLLTILIFTIALSYSLFGQVRDTPVRWFSTASLPAACNPTNRNQALAYNFSTGTLLKCSSGSYVSTGGGGATIGGVVTGGTATRVLYIDGSGNLANSPNLTFNGSMLTAATLSGSNIIKSGASECGIFYASASALLTQDANLCWDATLRRLRVTAAGADKIPFDITLASAQTANAFNLTSNGGSDGDLFNISADGTLFVKRDTSAVAIQALGTSGGTTQGIRFHSSGLTDFIIANANKFRIADGLVQLPSNSEIFFNSSTANNAANDAGIKKLAAKVLASTDGGGGAGLGWFVTDGNKRLSADVTEAAAAMTNLTGLSVTLAAGRTYSFKLILFVSDSVAADGIKCDFDGGTLTATDFRAHGTLFDTSLLLSTQTTALATDFSQATITGSGMFEIHGTVTVNAGGTFIPRCAQNAHTTGTLTVFRGSNIVIEDIP